MDPNPIKKEAISSNISKFYRFPLTACDILSTDNSTTIDFFLPEGKIFTERIVSDIERVEVEVDDPSD